MLSGQLYIGAIVDGWAGLLKNLFEMNGPGVLAILAF